MADTLINVVDPDTGEIGSLPESQFEGSGYQRATEEQQLKNPEAQQEEPLVNVKDPETGEIGSLPQSQFQGSGFEPASDQEAKHYVLKQKYGSKSQTNIGMLEEASRMMSFGLSPLAEEAMGVKREDILGRKEVLSTPATMASGIAGLASSLLIPGLGEANILRAIGEGGASALGLSGAKTILGKIGSAAARTTIESSVLAGTDEVSKFILKDPEQSIGSAAANIGLSGLIGAPLGAGLGAISPLWEAKFAPKVNDFLKAVTDKANGVEHVPVSIDEAIDAAGMKLEPEIRAGYSSNPAVKEAWQEMQESPTDKGTQFRDSIANFKKESGNYMAGALGKQVSEIPEKVSAFEDGAVLKKTLAEEISEKLKPTGEKFEEIKKPFTGVDVTPGDHILMQESLSTMANLEGLNVTDLSGAKGLVDRVIKEIPNIQTLKNLTDYQTDLGRFGRKNFELSHVVGNIQDILREAESDIISRELKVPELVEQFRGLRKEYRADMNFLSSLNDYLNVGKYRGLGTFLNNLKNNVGEEDALRRLSGKNSAAIYDTLTKTLPRSAEIIKNHQINKILSAALERSGDESFINAQKVIKSIKQTGPEQLHFIGGDAGEKMLQAIADLTQQLPKTMNPSGTARTAAALKKMTPGGGLMNLIDWGLGKHGANIPFVSGMYDWARSELPASVKLSTLKFLGEPKPQNAAAYKAMTSGFTAIYKGQELLKKAVKGVFEPAADVIPKNLMPNNETREKLKKILGFYRSSSDAFDNVGGKLGYYLPEHATALATLTAKAHDLLAKPETNKKSPLDSKTELSQAEQDKYHRILDAAEQPLVVLDHIKNGSLLGSEVQIVHALYPALYREMSSQIMGEIAEREHNEEPIPYRVRLGLSIFLNQPLDSTMTPEAIQLTQMKPSAQPHSEQAPRHSMSHLKMGQMDQTQGQAREARHLKG